MVKNNRPKLSLKKRAKKIKLLIMDVDGVLTQGYIILGNDGGELKFFDVQDGFGISLWRKAGLKSAIITAGTANAVKKRAACLKIDSVYQGRIDKQGAYKEIKDRFKLTDSQICFIGDDLVDLPILKKVGLACCVPNARRDIMPHVHYISKREGGRGAVREIIELVLKAQRRWDEVTEDYFKIDEK